MSVKRKLLIGILFLWTPAVLANEQPVSFVTDDDITIAAVLSMPAGDNDKSPAVIFIHQGGLTKANGPDSLCSMLLCVRG